MLKVCLCDAIWLAGYVVIVMLTVIRSMCIWADWIMHFSFRVCFFSIAWFVLCFCLANIVGKSMYLLTVEQSIIDQDVVQFFINGLRMRFKVSVIHYELFWLHEYWLHHVKANTIHIVCENRYSGFLFFVRLRIFFVSLPCINCYTFLILTSHDIVTLHTKRRKTKSVTYMTYNPKFLF